eukprot:Skav221445  [mRNA]  locus=scaffold140:122696:125024:+ [translate_table: standard]
MFCQEAHLLKIQTLFQKFGAEGAAFAAVSVPAFGRVDLLPGGVITFEAFQRNLKAAEVREYFQTLGALDSRVTCQSLDVWDAWSFFKLLDEDGGGEVEVEAPREPQEFLMGCLRLRGQATAMDVGRLALALAVWAWGKFQAYVEVELKQLKEYLALLTGVNLSSDEHIGLIFGDHNGAVGKTRSTDYEGPDEEPDEPAQDEISKQIRDYSYKFDRRISP